MTSDDTHSAAHQHNRAVWDKIVRSKGRFARPARDDDFKDPLKTVDAAGWLGGNIRGKKLLCLAAGGGRQSALYAAAGATVTVVDISPAMLELDREVAAQRGLNIRTVEASMDFMPMLTAGEFELVIHPVSTCYVPDIGKVFREVARVTGTGGIYISQHKQPVSLQADTKPSPHGYELTEPYYREGPLPAADRSRIREEGALEYLHRWEELLGGMCRAGFAIQDLTEPFHSDDDAEAGAFGHRSKFVAPYVRIKAQRCDSSKEGTSPSKLWMP